MIEVITAVAKTETEGVRIFLAGGITNCKNWQADLIKKMKEQNIDEGIDLPILLFNPRRENFPIDDPNASREQIEWEFNELRDAHIIIFWFSKGSLNPIVLYELGMWGNSRGIPIVVGIDEGYERQQDVEIQTMLARDDVTIVYSLDDMVKEVNDILGEIA